MLSRGISGSIDKVLLIGRPIPASAHESYITFVALSFFCEAFESYQEDLLARIRLHVAAAANPFSTLVGYVSVKLHTSYQLAAHPPGPVENLDDVAVA